MGHRVIAVERFESFRDDRVQMTSARLPQLGVDNLLQQRMRKVVPDVIDSSALLDDALREQLFERCYQFHLTQTGYTCECIVRSASADNRGEIRKSAGLYGESVHARGQDFANRRWHAKGFGFPPGPLPSALRDCS